MDRFEQPLKEAARQHAEIDSPSKVEAMASMTEEEARVYSEGTEKLAEWRKVGATLEALLSRFVSNGGAQLSRALHEASPPRYADSLAVFGVSENTQDGVVSDIHSAIAKLAEGLGAYRTADSTRDAAAAAERAVPTEDAVEHLKRISLAAKGVLESGGLVDIETARQLCAHLDVLGDLSVRVARATLALRDIHSAIYECFHLEYIAVVRAELDASSKQNVDDLNWLLAKRRRTSESSESTPRPTEAILLSLPAKDISNSDAGASETQTSTQELTQPHSFFSVPGLEAATERRGRALSDARVPRSTTQD